MYEENLVTQNSTVPEGVTDNNEIKVDSAIIENSKLAEQNNSTSPQEVEVPPLPQPNKLKGIESIDELKNLEVLRTEFASTVFKPKVILSYETISFNKACLNLLPGIKYVNVLIDRQKKRIIILPVTKHTKDALQWSSINYDGQVKKRVCTAKKFGEKLYDMMQWVKENRYRVIAYYQEIDDVHLLVFNLSECEMVVPEFVTTKTGKLVKRGKVYLPDSWQNGFGMSLTQHNEANEVELNAHYTLSDKDLDVTLKDVKILGRIPTDEEIIISQYRKEKSQEVLVNA
jgi:hypothetical protein